MESPMGFGQIHKNNSSVNVLTSWNKSAMLLYFLLQFQIHCLEILSHITEIYNLMYHWWANMLEVSEMLFLQSVWSMLSEEAVHWIFLSVSVAVSVFKLLSLSTRSSQTQANSALGCRVWNSINYISVLLVDSLFIIKEALERGQKRGEKRSNSFLFISYLRFYFLLLSLLS
jgi:hypothetical protein